MFKVKRKKQKASSKKEDEKLEEIQNNEKGNSEFYQIQKKETKETQIKEIISKNGIRAKIIIEILASKKENIISEINEHLESIDKSNTVGIVEINTFEPDYDEKYSAWHGFVDADLLFENIEIFVEFCFKVSPTSVEIIEPQEFKYDSRHFTSFFNTVISLLNELNTTFKKTFLEKEDLLKAYKVTKEQNYSLIRNLILNTIKNNPLDVEEIEKKTGLKGDMNTFLNSLEKEGFVEKKIIEKNNKKIETYSYTPKTN
jgi:DNA-binding MarR family transcriptional regulator